MVGACTARRRCNCAAGRPACNGVAAGAAQPLSLRLVQRVLFVRKIAEKTRPVAVHAFA